MNTFQVTEIIDGNTVRVSPSWAFETPEGQEYSDNKVKILGLGSDAANKLTEFTLDVLLKNKEVELVNPKIVAWDKTRPIIACKVLIDKTDVTYYFSKNSDKPNSQFAYA